MTFTAARASLLFVWVAAMVLGAGCGSGGAGTTGVFTGTTGTAGNGIGGLFGGGNGSGTSGTGRSSATTTTSGGSSGNCPTAGQSCSPANVCDLGEVACDAQGDVGCADLGQPDPSQNGASCDGSGSVCDNGTCVACDQGVACQPQNLCDLGALDCSTGQGVCEDTGTPDSAANGQSCGNGGTCQGGSCITCNPGASCTPTNLCDQGTLDCSGGANGVCVDQGSNPSQNGVTCASGKICENGGCVSQTSGSTGTTGGTGGGTNWPIVPDQGAPVISSPHLVFMTYSDDLNQATFEQYGLWIADGGYLPTVAGQYGVDNGTARLVNLGPSSTAPIGTVSNQNAFPNYIQGLIDDGTIPAFAQNNIYVLILPSAWADTDTFCQSEGGYHTYYQDGAQNGPVYAIVPNCLGTQAGALQQEEAAISHEVVEAATDPYVTSWQIQDMSNPWYYLGGEVGDLCASNTTYYTSGQFVAQLIWSNQAVSAGEVPCQPWPASSTYVSLIAPATLATASPGGQAHITVTGWASGPYGSFGLAAVDGDYGVDFSTAPTLSSSTITPGGTVTVTLNVPSTAAPGEHGAAWIVAQDFNTDQDVGSAMVGVVVQ